MEKDNVGDGDLVIRLQSTDEESEEEDKPSVPLVQNAFCSHNPGFIWT